MFRIPVARERVAFVIRDITLVVAPIEMIAGASMLVALATGNFWLTSGFLLFDNKANPASLPLVLLGQTAVIGAMRLDRRKQFALTFAAGMSIVTIAALALNVLMAMIGDNFEGPTGESGWLIVYVLLQVVLFAASMVAFAVVARTRPGRLLDGRGVVAVLVWASSFIVFDAILRS